MAESKHLDFVNSLAGQTVSAVWRGAGTAIFLELGKLENNADRPKGEYGIGIEWSWRIEEGSAILLGSFSEDSQISEVAKLVTGQTVEGIKFFGNIPEVCINFCSGQRLVSFATSEGGPEWSVRVRETTIDVQSGRFVYESN